MDHNIETLVTSDHPIAEQPIPKLDTIKNTHSRLRAAGYLISEASLRGWVRNGKIRHIPQGRKALIYFTDVVAFLENYPAPAATAAS